MVSIVLKNQEKMAFVSEHHAMTCLPLTWILGKDGYPRLEGLFGLRMHHFIWQLDNPGSTKGKVIDHINRDRLDNRIENLRLILPLENNWNRSLQEMSNIKQLKNGFRVSVVRGGQKLSTKTSTLEEAIAIREAHRF
jgi:hypothetical protein